MGIFPPDIGIDLGSTNVIFYATGRGIVLREPSLVVVRNNASRDVMAVGEEARMMMGRMPGDLIALNPIVQGVIADFELTEVMLRYFFRKAIGVNYIGRPRVVVTIPSELSAMERRAVDEAFHLVGIKTVHMVEAVVAAALGSGLPVYEPQGNLVVDIGGGTTEAAVIALGSIVAGRSIRKAGATWDAAIASHLRQTCNLLIGDRTAEEVKMDLGSAVPITDVQRAMVRGRDLVTGLPQTVEVSNEQVYEALKEPMQELLQMLIWVLERTPPELGADIMRTGIHLTGGGVQLAGMDQLLANELGIPVLVARNPIDCVALGAGYLATNLELLSRIGKNHPLTE